MAKLRWDILGRVFLSGFFILAGLQKIFNYSAVLDFMQVGGLPYGEILLPAVILLEVMGGALLWLRGRLGMFAALALAGFTFLTNLAFHDFWTMEGQLRQTELSLFFKNLAIMGGLFILAQRAR